MSFENFKKALKIVHDKFENKNIKWAVIASSNLKLQGLNANPSDLDIVTEFKNLSLIKELFSEYEVSGINKLEKKPTPIFEVLVKINDVEVQFSSGENDEVYVRRLLDDKIVKIKVDEVEIPCFTLDAEIKAYEETNRKHKADLIREFLNNT